MCLLVIIQKARSREVLVAEDDRESIVSFLDYGLGYLRQFLDLTVANDHAQQIIEFVGDPTGKLAIASIFWAWRS